MNIKNWFKPTEKSINLDPVASSSTSFFTIFRQSKHRDTDYASLIERDCGYVYTCAHLNAKAIAGAEWKVYVKGGTTLWPTGENEELLEHPVIDLLKSANAYHTGRELLELTAEYLELTGNAYWYVERDALGVPAGLYPLMSQHVEIVPDKSGVVKSYVYGTGASKQVFNSDEIIHFKYTNPANIYYGLSPLEAAVKAADRLTAMSDYEQALYDNHARPDLLITAPGGMSDEEAKALLEQWKSTYGGVRRSGMPGVLDGDIKIERLNYDPVDTGILESFKLSREELCAAFGVPTQFLTVSQSRAELDTAKYIYAENTIEPRLRIIESVINERLIPMYDGTGRLYLQFDSTVPNDQTIESQILKTYTDAGIMTCNEARAKLGLPPVEGGDMLMQAKPNTGGTAGDNNEINA
ncbi:MAG: phage portal protein [Armatimonadota bacterium]